ncbi:Hsp70 family protein [Mycobacterium sp.]|uniref:Hsp70 family protein n=1 Tax=Mycobacterium sp. TaxID=1785 RepID=UPI002D6A2B9E|nr:Hsp70 family protein [Mycobacterium sp.]HZA09009.1 Hsp70 family protein [Mycobacterium sp.]
MTDSLGLSIGTTNLVAAPATGAPTIRRAMLTLFSHRPPEVGAPSENPQLDEQGLVLNGFVERVGDPVPLVASDGSKHRGERLVAEALQALTRAVSPTRPPEQMSATVPAHWQPNVVDTLRNAVAIKPALCPQGQPLALVSDAVAALTALQSQAGLPARGVVALCDFGATGTSITLADAAARFASVGPTVRYEELSGDLIDQAILRQVLTDLDIDPSSTSAVVALSRVREQCRIAKERLSFETATGFTGPVPGAQSTVRLTRGELEAALRDPLDGFLATLEETLQRNNIAQADLVALATTGGGASIPFVTQRLSEVMRMPVTTAGRPQVTAALGARLIAVRGAADESATGLATAVAPMTLTAPAAALTETAAQTAAAESPVLSLAWSEDESTDDIAPAAYSDYTGDQTDRARPQVHFQNSEYGDGDDQELPPLPWYRRPGVLFAAAAFAVLLAGGGFLVTTKMAGLSTVPANTTGTPTPSAVVPLQAPAAGPAQAPPQAPPQAPQQAPQQGPEPVLVQQPNVVQRQLAPAPQQVPAPQPGPQLAPPPPQPLTPPLPNPAQPGPGPQQQGQGGQPAQGQGGQPAQGQGGQPAQGQGGQPAQGQGGAQPAQGQGGAQPAQGQGGAQPAQGQGGAQPAQGQGGAQPAQGQGGAQPAQGQGGAQPAQGQGGQGQKAPQQGQGVPCGQPGAGC